MSRKIKFTVSIKELAFAYEGDAETGEEVQRGIERTLGGIVGMQNRAMGLEDQSQYGKVVDVPSAPAKSKKRRKIGSASNGDGEANGSAGKAKGVPGLVQKLIDEGFMTEQRTVEAVRAELSNRGHVLKSPHVSTVLKQFATKELLQRKPNDDGVLVYWVKSPS